MEKFKFFKEVFASNDGISLEQYFNPPFKTLGEFVTVVLNNAFYLAGFLFLILLIAGALSFIIGAGNQNPEKLEKSKKTITWALIGFLIVISAYFIMQIIQVITKVNILGPPA